MKKNEMMVKRAFNTAELAVFILDDGSWDGSRDDAGRFRMLEIGHDELAGDPDLPFRYFAEGMC